MPTKADSGRWWPGSLLACQSKVGSQPADGGCRAQRSSIGIVQLPDSEASACGFLRGGGGGKHDALIHVGQQHRAADHPQVHVGLGPLQWEQGPRATLLPVLVVNEGVVLRHQYIVSQRWQPGTIAAKLLAPIKRFRGGR